MSDLGKTARLIEKLLRLTATDSGATEAERANAALEVCRLLNEKGIKKPDEPTPPPRARRRERPYWAAPPDDETANYGADDAYYDTSHVVRETKYKLVELPAPYTVKCDICKGGIVRGEHVWRKSGVGLVEFYHHRCL
jgi:hypothetical protein